MKIVVRKPQVTDREPVALSIYSLDDLAEARAELEKWRGAFERYDGNNPGKYQTDIKNAREKVDRITASLKASGVLERTEHEKLEARIDAVFPNARSKEVVSFEGRQYMRKFWPEEKSRSGKTVTRWGKGWELVKTGSDS
ncbi:hypothetical protein [Roseibium sp.]|uniref:hypothetical protein n=1 Tax=Roseibium sp. TaxID=1936156 RepID=UPI003BB154C7